MGKKTTKQTQTTTPNAPSWVSPQVQGLTTKVAGLADQDPTSFVAPANDLLQLAGSNASGMTFDPSAYQSANGMFQGIMDSATPTITAGDSLGLIGQYMSPYIQQVMDPTMAAYDKGAGQQQAQARLNRAMSDDFGGSGGDIYEADLGGNLALGRGQLSGGILNQGWSSAGQMADSQANRNQQASIAQAQLAAQMQAQRAQAAQGIVDTAGRYYGDQAGIIGTQLAAGQPQQQIDQATAGAPIDQLSKIIAAYGGMNGSNALLTGQTTTGKTTSSGGIGGIIGGLGSIALGLGTGGLGFGLGGLGGMGGGLTGASSLSNFA